jgi:anionic cell wall polymer biosynthesis LytR-Cps2A-Psr (LCP) family protein
MKNKKWIFIIIGIVVLCICFIAGGIIKKIIMDIKPQI